MLERSRFAVETGAAMHMAPNATALLEWMDIRPSEVGGTLLRQVGVSNSQLRIVILILLADASLRLEW